jgi:lipoprotein-anchoring transpeptidase ErfK/SrfK
MKFKLTSLLLVAALATPYTVFADEPTSDTAAVYDLDVGAADNLDLDIELTDNSYDAVSDTETTADEAVSQAAEDDNISSADPALISDAVGVDITIAPHQAVIDSVARFNLFNSKGELVGTDEQWIGGETSQLRLQFSVPQYVIGDTFTLGLVDGLKELRYYDGVITPGGSFELATYATTDPDGDLIHGNNFAMDAEPNFERAVNFYYNGDQISLWPYGRVVDGVSMVSAYDIGKALGIPVEYHSDYNSLTFSMGSNQLIFNLDTAYATFFGTDTYVSHYPFFMDDTIYVPIRDVLNAFGCSIDLWQSDDHIDVIAGKSSVIQEFRNKERVNREGISSRTGYLIWVSKSDYQVKVYKGSRYNWECIRTAPCAIGAPDTPTIEGQFEYQYNSGVWSYPNFYVYPTMVFYGGYALHSTLKAWGGGLYDDSVGVQISHGCVRLHPEDIDWIYSIIPVGTKVYVTP